MIPTKGRIVILLGIHSNGSDEHPAVITRAWAAHDTSLGPVAVNLTIFPDMQPPTTRSSVMLFESAALARQAQGGNAFHQVAHWPELVPTKAPAVVARPSEPERQQAA